MRPHTVSLVGMYPTEAFGLAPLLLRAVGLATPGLAGVEFPVTFAAPPEGGAAVYDIEGILEEVLASRPSVVGMSCYVWNRTAVLELADALRRRAPETFLVVGGPEVETREAAASVLSAGALDVAVRGEGEATFPDLLLRYFGGGPGSELPLGVSVRRDGGIVETPDRGPIEPLDSIATPFQESIADFRGINRIPCFETYRGCTMRCKFCNWGKARGVRFFGLDRVKSDLDFILNLDIERIWFVDAIFNLESLRYKEILRHLIRSNHRGIACDFEMMGELLDEEGIQLIAQLPGGSSIAFGLQSTDHEVVREAWRPHNFRRFSANLQALRAAAPHVDVLIDLIFGMPRDTPEKFQQSILAAVDLNPTRLQVHPFMVLTGTQFYDEREHYRFRNLGGLTVTEEVDLPEVGDFNWYAYWAQVFNSPRHRQTIERIHSVTGRPRAALLCGLMDEYEQQFGRVQFDDMPQEAKATWQERTRLIHDTVADRFGCPAGAT